MRKPKNPTSLRCLRTAFLVPCITASLASTACNRARPFEMYRIKPNVGPFKNTESNNVGGYFAMVGATKENLNRFFSLKARLVTAKNRVDLVDLDLGKLVLNARGNGRQTKANHAGENIEKVLLLQQEIIECVEPIVKLIENYLNKEYGNQDQDINIENQLFLLQQRIESVESSIESIEKLVHTMNNNELEEEDFVMVEEGELEEEDFVMVGATEENINRFFSLKARLVTAKNRVDLVDLDLGKLILNAWRNGKQTEANRAEKNIEKVLLLKQEIIGCVEPGVEFIKNYLNNEYLNQDQDINIEDQLFLLQQRIESVESSIESIEKLVHTRNNNELEEEKEDFVMVEEGNELDSVVIRFRTKPLYSKFVQQLRKIWLF